jgi:hypothetical protein
MNHTLGAGRRIKKVRENRTDIWSNTACVWILAHIKQQYGNRWLEIMDIPAGGITS